MGEKRARTRDTYHHGDLRAALLTAGIGLAREGGPDAVVLREVTRVVGVAPNSAYGHFPTLTALKKAVAQRARADMAEAMSAHLGAVSGPGEDDEPAAGRGARTGGAAGAGRRGRGARMGEGDVLAAAKARLCEVGRAYVRFAL